jgi:hypothetical protein
MRRKNPTTAKPMIVAGYFLSRFHAKFDTRDFRADVTAGRLALILKKAL